MSESVRILDPVEIQAVQTGEIDGDLYSDREVWADSDELERWRLAHRSDGKPYGSPPAHPPTLATRSG